MRSRRSATGQRGQHVRRLPGVVVATVPALLDLEVRDHPRQARRIDVQTPEGLGEVRRGGGQGLALEREAGPEHHALGPIRGRAEALGQPEGQVVEVARRPRPAAEHPQPEGVPPWILPHEPSRDICLDARPRLLEEDHGRRRQRRPGERGALGEQLVGLGQDDGHRQAASEVGRMAVESVRLGRPPQRCAADRAAASRPAPRPGPASRVRSQR